MSKKKINKIFDILCETFSKKRKMLICGNGGSAAVANHIAGEFVSTFIKKKRKSYPAISLCENTSTLTAIGNDFGYKYIFDRQIEALGSEDDTLILMSTSGKSENIKYAIKRAKIKKINTIGLFGFSKTKITMMCKNQFYFKTKDTARLQENHLYIMHEVCRLFENIK